MSNELSGSGENFNVRMNDTTSGLPLEVGIVVRSGSGSYDIEVLPVRGELPVTCIYMAASLATNIGVSDCRLPPLGSYVLFMRFGWNARYGAAFASAAVPDPGYPNKFHSSFPTVPSGGTSGYCSKGYLQLGKEKRSQFIFADESRPNDIYPGDSMQVNEHGVMLGILKLMVTLSATQRAKVEAFVLDDLVRIVSGHFQHFHSLGDFQIYNDAGRLSMEFRSTSHQQEYYGTEEYKPFAALRSQEREKENVTSGSEQVYDPKKEGAVDLKERLQAFIGDLGNLVHMVVCNPELAVDDKGNPVPRFRGTSPNHAGLFQQAVTPSGVFALRSADSIIMTRNDNIPVPVKVMEPWDANGDDPTKFKREPDKPFRLGDNDPWGASLLLRDQVAWIHKQLYGEFDLHEKDWHAPDEEDVPYPPNTYDRIDGDHTDYDRCQDRKSYVAQLRDGSIVFRDAWGSEINMRGGNIIISCPGQLEFRSGKSTVVMAGHDLCMKGRKSVDISASDRDVRIKAQGNMQITAVDRGVLIQSYSDVESRNSANRQFKFAGDAGGHKKGEDVESAGIILKSEKDRIFIYGWTTQIAAACYIFIETLMAGAFGGAKKNKPSPWPSDAGKIVISSANRLIHRCKNYMLSVAGLTGIKSGVGRSPTGEAYGSLNIFGSQVQIMARSENGPLLVGNGAAADKDNVPMKIGKIIYDDDKTGDVKLNYKTLMEAMVREDEEYRTKQFLKKEGYWTYDPDNPEGDMASQRYWIDFTFRTPEQYGTGRASEMKYAPTDVTEKGSTDLSRPDTMDWHKMFRIYQSPWQQMYDADPDMVVWSEVIMNGTAPWPGWGWGDKDQIFSYLEEEQNVDYKGIARKRKDMKSDAKDLKVGNMLKYKVMAHNAQIPDELTQ